MGPQSLSGFVSAVLRVVGSTVVGKHSAVLVGGDGGVEGESVTDAEAYGAPGIVFRPRPPSVPSGEVEELAAEAMALRTPAGLIPVAWRDLRLHRRFPSPKVGTVALVGYGGGFLSFDDADGDTTLATLKVPYGAKAHTITLTPDGSLTLLHGDGGKVELKVGGNVEINGVVFTPSGAINAPGEIKALSGGPGVKLSTHLHPTAMGPSGAPTPGT